MQSQIPAVDTNQQTQNLSFAKVLAGNVSIGSPASYDSAGNPATFTQDNGDGILIRVGTFTNPFSLANSWAGNTIDTTITHNLGRVPIGYYVTKKTVSCDVYDGSISPTTSTITLRNTNGINGDTIVYIF